jgi:hypothetical protein
MTLILAVIVGETTVIVADRARSVSNGRRDETARKLVIEPSGALVVAIAGHVALGSRGRPEEEINGWITELAAQDQSGRGEWLRAKVELNAGTASDVGTLLLFDRERPGAVTTLTLTPNGSGIGAIMSTSELSRLAPTVWGVKQSWSSVSAIPWTPTTDVTGALEIIKTAVSTYASSDSQVSTSTDHATVSATH